MRKTGRPERDVQLPNTLQGFMDMPGGDWLRLSRQYKNVTVKEMARRLGVSRSAISQFEKPTNRPNAATRRRYEDALGLKPHELDNIRL